MSEIINNVAEVLMWDIFLMGVFNLLILTVGIMWLIATSRKNFIENIRKLANKVVKLDLAHAVVILVVALAAIYYVGIISNNLSDSWIDKKGWKHLYLTPTWLPDDLIKVKLFATIYPIELASLGYEPDTVVEDPDSANKQTKNDIRDFYYYAKNKLWENQIWRKYILYSQKMINISRVWCFAFFLLFFLTLLRFLVCALRFLLWKRATVHNDCKPNLEITCSLVMILLAIAGYHVGGTVWQSNEEEIDSKIFGVYKSLFGNPPQIAKSIENNKCGYKLSVLATDRPSFEASGVAAFDGHLFIVNDKDNNLYVANPQAPACPLKLVEVPKFGKDKAKFEDISLHPESGYFYVIGAHYKTIPNYQKVFRFKLKKVNENWKPMHVEEIPVSEDILRHLSDRDGVEGIAVAGDVNTPRLFVGIRSTSPGRFLILEFSWKQAEFVMQSSYELKLSPIYSSDGVDYHLSGLAAMSNEKLLVLVSSEDKDNKFHGNRVYTVDLRKLVMDWVTPEFEQAQKAEGIAAWKKSKSQWKIAIVFDNDIEDTGKQSQLLILNSLSTLCR